MIHETRALRRASQTAAAHAAARRSLRSLIAGVSLFAGVALTASFVAPAAMAADSEGITALQGMSARSGSLASYSAKADRALDDAEAAVEAARGLKRQVAASGLPVARDVVAIDTGRLQTAIDTLRDEELVPALLLPDMTTDAVTATAEVVQETDDLQVAFQVAQEQKAAEEAARAAAEALAAANTPDGAKATARTMAADRYGWGEGQFSCLESLWSKESGWNYQAYNPSGATGIPQALPGSKMASAGGDWQTNAATQIAWGLGYIDSVYGSPCSAWSHSQAMNWY